MTLRIAPQVQRAVNDGAAVVALESTVVTHGLPRPRNLDTVRELEATVRRAGAVPATVGLVGGELVVGLSDSELVRLASGGADKASLWNLAALMAAGGDAGTTVATTVHAAHAAGIGVFATGGIGGVHDAAFDESADIAALATTPVVTICAGPKSILDASATLERLESRGVPVIGYGTDRLAGFHVPVTDLPVAARADDPAGVAAIKRAQDLLGLRQAIVVAKPVSHGLDHEDLLSWLGEARAEAAAAGVQGKDATPFLLEALARRSNGATVEVNVRLLHENAALAAAIAVALATQESGVPA